MKPFIIATDNVGNEISVDPNVVRINDAGTNMTVATYPEKELNRGNTQPIFADYRHLLVEKEDRAILENIFELEKAKQHGEEKSGQKAFRKYRKEKTTVVATTTDE